MPLWLNVCRVCVFSASRTTDRRNTLRFILQLALLKPFCVLRLHHRIVFCATGEELKSFCLNVQEPRLIIQCSFLTAPRGMGSHNKAVDTLSDDDYAPVVPAAVAATSSECPPKKSCLKASVQPGFLRGRLARLTNQLCECARQNRATTKHSCYRQFHGSGLEALFQLCWALSKLDKQDMDVKVGHFSKHEKLRFQSLKSVNYQPNKINPKSGFPKKCLFFSE